jgi:cadmium resistance protein CadD (predicted permease)
MPINPYGLIWLVLAILAIFFVPEKYRNNHWVWAIAFILFGISIQQTLSSLYAHTFVAYVFYGFGVYILIDYDWRTTREFILNQALD